MKRVICVVGPTASGKTSLAVRLAKELDGEVISCDSMQVYRGMDVGTAKPTAEEMQGVVHHMLDVADPAESFSVGRFTELADPILQDVLARGKTAVLAGGTGLYIDALVSGRSFSDRPDGDLRRFLEDRADREGTEVLLRELAEADPETASRLHLKDRKRIIRALEVWLSTGITMAEHDRQTRQLPPKYDAAWLGLWYSDRRVLYERIGRRVDLMLQQGLLEEIRLLLEAGFSENSTAFAAIGYKEFLAAMQGKESFDEAAEAVKQGTRRYAKRQMTWFRRNEAIFWLDRCVCSNENDLFSAARRHLAEFDG